VTAGACSGAVPPCPLCLAAGGSRFYAEGPRAYYHCSRCDLRFLDPVYRPCAAAERSRYLLHENDVADPGYRAFVQPLHDHVAQRVPAGATGLDFGSGTGSALADMLGHSGYEIRRFDPFFDPDRASLQRLYDFVVACEVVEHLFDPHTEFQRLKALLVRGGLLGLMTLLWTPEVQFADWHYRRDPTHVAFYSRVSFRWIADRFGFQAVHFAGPRVISLRA
jgi:hypothetical protein